MELWTALNTPVEDEAVPDVEAVRIGTKKKKEEEDQEKVSRLCWLSNMCLCDDYGRQVARLIAKLCRSLRLTFAGTKAKGDRKQLCLSNVILMLLHDLKLDPATEDSQDHHLEVRWFHVAFYMVSSLRIGLIEMYG